MSFSQFVGDSQTFTQHIRECLGERVLCLHRPPLEALFTKGMTGFKIGRSFRPSGAPVAPAPLPMLAPSGLAVGA